MTVDLDAIKQRILAGEVKGLEAALTSFLNKNPNNEDAWLLMAMLFNDAVRKIYCYRQVLRSNPTNRSAGKLLLEWTEWSTQPATAGESPSDINQFMRCAQCGGAMEVQYIGEMRDKRVVCPYCITEVDLPDSYQRVKKIRTQVNSIFGKRTTDETIVETRGDRQLSPKDYEKLPPELQEVIGIIKKKGSEGLDEDHLKELQA